jgi:ubiquitin-conjugating enzyme E2 G1
MNKFSKALLQKQFKDLSKTSSDLGFSVGLFDDNDFYKWSVVLFGPENTIYEGGYFKASLLFPEDYPYSPPSMKFITQMFHPNIYPNGDVCISILHKPGFDIFNEQEKAEEKWRPSLGVEKILLSVISLFDDPNCDSPANIDAAVMLKNDPEQYKSIVRSLVYDSMEDL